MKQGVLRRAAPYMMAAALVAVAPQGGVAQSRAGANRPDGSQSTRHVLTRARSIPSLGALAAANQAAPSGAQSGGTANDARQTPTRTTHRPAGAAAPTTSTLAVPVVSPTPVTNNGGFVHSFAGLNVYEERIVASGGNQFTFTPPDQGLCVGNGIEMEAVNDAIRFYSTTGHPLTAPIGTNAFLGYPPDINRTTGEFGPEPTDPSCYFDPQYGKWFFVTLTLDTNPKTGSLTLTNHLDIAVSATADPTAGWVFYHLAVQDDGTQGTPAHTSCPCIGDYPHIGADANGFYITTNEYPFGSGPGEFGNNFNGAQIYVFSKFSLAQNSGTVPVVQLSHLALANGTPSFTLWPSEVPGTNFDTRHSGSEWFTQSTAAIQETINPSGMSDNIAVWRLSNTAAIDTADTDALVLVRQTLHSDTYGVPPASEQKAGSVPLRDCLQTACRPGIGPSKGEVEGPLDSSDSRILTDWFANNLLYTALDTVVQVNGKLQAGVAYFILTTADHIGATTISAQGYQAVAGNIIYPSIATLPDGTGAMAITLAGPSNFPTAAFMSVGPQGPTGPVKIARSGSGPQDDFCEYVFYNCAQTPTPAIRPRWGDYGAAQVTGSQVWIASEYIGQTCTIATYQTDPTCGGTRATLANWGTRITQVTP